jgi:UDP-glucose 6-dehydrogenase
MPPDIAAMTNLAELHRLEQQVQFEVHAAVEQKSAQQDVIDRLIDRKIALNKRIIEIMELEFKPKMEDDCA